MRIKSVQPAHPQSDERLCHDTGIPAFVLPLRGTPAGAGNGDQADRAREALLKARLERAIGVIYRPETERQSHYFPASLPRQFDEYVWIDETSAVTPLASEPQPGVPDTYPFGL